MVGRFVHEIFESLYQLPPPKRSQENLKGLASDTYVNYIVNDPEFEMLELDAEGVKQFKIWAWVTSNKLYDIEDPTTIDVISTEYNLDVKLNGRVPFTGKVDRVERINGKLIITDYKTGKAPRQIYMQDKLNQVILYGAAFRQDTEENPSKAKLIFLGGDSKVVKTALSSSSMGRMENWIETTWDNIHTALETDEFSPKPGPLCGWCPHLDICSEGQEYIQDRIDRKKQRMDAPSLALMGITPAQKPS
jgi:putative RecB family exonuclease